MQFLYKLNNLFRPARMTRLRMAIAVLVALAADGLQIPGQAIPLAPEIIDVIAMVLTTLAIGFHLLLLPTFALEFIPLVDMLPTWTGCVIAVIALRRGDVTGASNPSAPPIIEVESSRIPSQPSDESKANQGTLPR